MTNTTKLYRILASLVILVTAMAPALFFAARPTPVEAKPPKGGGGSKPPQAYDKLFHFQFLGAAGGETSWAKGINKHGDIVGRADSAGGAFLSLASDRSHLINLYDDLLHEDYKATDTRDGWVRLNFAHAVNDVGQIVGRGLYKELPSTYSTRGFLMTMDEQDDFYHIEDLGSLDPAGINNNGDVTGTFETEDGTRAFLWLAVDPDPVDLGVLYGGDNYSTANAVNAAGQVAGFSGQNPGEFSAFRFTSGAGMQDLGVFKPERGGFSQGFAYDLNDTGVVVGNASAGGWSRHAFRWDGTLQDLGTFGGDRSVATGINNHGEVVGWAQDENDTYHAFLYVDGIGMLKLADYTDLPAGSILTNRFTNDCKINDSLIILGNLRGPNDTIQAFVLTPIAF